MSTREAEKPEDSDFIERLFTCSTHDYLMFFTNLGRVYVERVHEIPDMGRAAKGRSIANLLELRAEERIQALVRVVAKYGPNKEDQTWQQTQELFFVTRMGTVKRTALSDFQNVRKGGIIAITLEQGDDLVEVCLTTGQNEIVLITKEGMSIRFAEEQVRSMGRNAAGVKGIELETDDCVVALALVDPDATLLVAGENGIGKRTSFEEYRAQSRGGKGIITMKTGDKTGKVVGALSVKDANELMLITVGGQMVRIPVRGIREAGRNTMGVKLIDLSEKDRLQAIAPVISETQEEEAVGGESTPAE
jgi:DNA gyrase subunit A